MKDRLYKRKRAAHFKKLVEISDDDMEPEVPKRRRLRQRGRKEFTEYNVIVLSESESNEDMVQEVQESDDDFFDTEEEVERVVKEKKKVIVKQHKKPTRKNTKKIVEEEEEEEVVIKKKRTKKVVKEKEVMKKKKTKKVIKETVEEEVVNVKPKTSDFTDVITIIQHVFPLTINRTDITLGKEPISDTEREHSRELIYSGKYKQVDVTCMCVLSGSAETDYRPQYLYAFEMSQSMLTCRNMANYYNMFLLKAPSALKQADIPLILTVKPGHIQSKLDAYLKLMRKKVTHLPTELVLRMSINLFSMLSDAHELKIGLVCLSTASLLVSDDNTLYFDAFESCVSITEKKPAKNKPWMDLSLLELTEADNTYSPSLDVYKATIIVTKLALDFTKKHLRKKDGGPFVFEKYIFHPHLQYIMDAMESGLETDLVKRPSASAMLAKFETARAAYLLDHSAPPE